MKYTLLFLDTESTGMGPSDRLCQLCMRTWVNGEITDEINELYKPSLPISIGAMAIHHITEKMVADKPAFSDSPEFQKVKSALADSNAVMVAHNAPFDATMLAFEGITPVHVIDTLKLVRHMDPNNEIERHNQQFLRYFWQLDDNLPNGTIINPHDAYSDVLILEQIFWYLFNKAKDSGNFENDDAIIEYMIKRSAEPALIGVFQFGKHIGKKVTDVARIDRGYLEWLLDQKQNQSDTGDDQADWIHTLKTALGVQ